MEYTLNEAEINELKSLRSNKISFGRSTLGSFLVFVTITAGAYFVVGFLSLENSGSNWYTRHKYQIFFITGIITTIILIVRFLFMKDYINLTKDIKKRSGIILEHTIIRKHYFPLTNDYYLFFNDYKTPNVRVKASDYNKFQIGGTYRIRKGKHSEIVLDDIERNKNNRDVEFINVGGYGYFDY